MTDDLSLNIDPKILEKLSNNLEEAERNMNTEEEIDFMMKAPIKWTPYIPKDEEDKNGDSQRR